MKMNSLKNLLIGAGLIGASFLPMKDVKGQTSKYDNNYTEKESDKGFASLKKGMELSVYEKIAMAYFDSSAHILNGRHSKEQLIQKVNLSLDYLNISEEALNLFIKKSRDYQPYENKDLSFTMGIETKLDTNKIKKFLPYFKELMEKEESFLKNPDEINSQIWLDNLTKEYNKTYAVIKFSLE